MSSYRDSSNYDPFHNARKPTRMEWVLAVICIVMAGVLLASAVTGDNGPAWLQKARSWPVAITELALALTFWLRARANRPDEVQSPRALRLTALAFVLLAVLTAAVTLLRHS